MNKTGLTHVVKCYGENLAYHTGRIILAVWFFSVLINFAIGQVALPRSNVSLEISSYPQGWQPIALRSPFEEPLISTSPTLPEEDESLQNALRRYGEQKEPDDLHVFQEFLASFPQSGWKVALLTNLGLAYYHYGYFSKAIDSWEGAWQAGQSLTEPRAKALVDRAFGELIRMHARLGHAEQLAVLVTQLGKRGVTGPATEALDGAKQGLWTMENDPGVAYLCGPMALKNLLLSQGAKPDKVQFLYEYRSGPTGVTLAQVSDLADKAALPHTIVYRAADQPIPVPSIVHWKLSHFAAIVGQQGDRFHIQDPTFGRDLWVTRRALETESSGYFLVPGRELAANWREVSATEARQVKGMGYTGSNESSATTPNDGKACNCDGQGSSSGMTRYDFTEMVVSLNLNDTPVGYAPPKGPAAYVTLTYNQREASQPGVFTFFNVSPKWTLNWLTYVQDDPTNIGASVTRYVAGGGGVDYTGYDSNLKTFASEVRDASVLQITSLKPITYKRNLANGSTEVYAASDGSTKYPRRIFLTKVIDPAGNSVSLTYDGQMRLISLQDATGRRTTFSYGVHSQPLLVSAITDPFGRSAKLAYDSMGRLSQITDVLGLTSKFTYDTSSLVNSMKTAYGTTKYLYGDDGNQRYLQASDPLGHTERLEYRQQAPGIPFSDPSQTVPQGIVAPFNQYLNGRDTFYWDKHVYPLANGDYTLARNKHWTHLASDTNITAHTVESIKYPFENRIWHNYPGQPDCCLGTAQSGTFDLPNRTGRVLDDGSTQLTQNTYNSLGHVTDTIDPVGRETQFVYDTNLIDVLQVLQKTSTSGFSTIAQFTYNSQHLPLTCTDAAGKTSKYSYNGAGQLTKMTDTLGETTTYQYDGSGYLLRVVNANAQTAASFTYDQFGRVATRTDSEGYTVAFAYDALDRLTKETYPDGTTRQYTWNRLDLATETDRQGNVTRYTYDANRDLLSVTDPLGRETKFTYYENGMLKSLTDPNGHTTVWNVDLENRVTAKEYADGTKLTYSYETTTSRLKAVMDALGQTKQYSYAVDDALAGLSYLNAMNPTPDVSFSYDAYFRRLLGMTDGSGTTQYQYVSVGSLGALQLLRETGPHKNATIAYRYDALGRVASRTVDTSKETFAYDKLGREKDHTDVLGTFSLGYLGQTSQLTSQVIKSGIIGTLWTYDTNKNDRRLKAITNSNATRSYQLATTAEDLIIGIVETAAKGSAWTPQTWSYSYDPSYRLVQATGTKSGQFVYGCDPGDNIITDGTKHATYNEVNEVSTFNGQGFTYDANGNLLEDGTRVYEWDAENRLISVAPISHTTQKTKFQYDGLSRRIAITLPNGSETHYLWCGDTLCQSRTSSDVVLRRYYPEGEYVVSDAKGLYYVQDQLGSVRDVLLQNGSRAASYDYDAYGNIIKSAGGSTTDFRYAGLFYDQQDGLYLAEYRAYDPITARWLSRDPIREAGGINLYGYVRNRPIGSFDPSGLAGGCGSGKGDGGDSEEPPLVGYAGEPPISPPVLQPNPIQQPIEDPSPFPPIQHQPGEPDPIKNLPPGMDQNPWYHHGSVA